jgi:hypothetical protein
MILHAGDNLALEAGKRLGAPIGSIGGSVITCPDQATDVSFAAIVVRRHLRVVQEGEQLVIMLEQPLPNPHTVGMASPSFQHQIVEAIDDSLVGFVEPRVAEPLSALAQLNGISKQVNERPNERPHRRMPGK